MISLLYNQKKLLKFGEAKKNLIVAWNVFYEGQSVKGELPIAYK